MKKKNKRSDVRLTLADGKFAKPFVDSIFVKHPDIGEPIVKVISKLEKEEKISSADYWLQDELYGSSGKREKQEIEKLIVHFYIKLNGKEHYCDICINHKFTDTDYAWITYTIHTSTYTLYGGTDLFDRIEELFELGYKTIADRLPNELIARENKKNSFLIDYGDRIADLDKKAKIYGMSVKLNDNSYDDCEKEMCLYNKEGFVILCFTPVFSPRFTQHEYYMGTVLGEKKAGGWSKEYKFKSHEEMFQFLYVAIDCIAAHDKLVAEQEKALSQQIAGARELLMPYLTL